jgi:Tfp pilus assembly protein PilN
VKQVKEIECRIVALSKEIALLRQQLQEIREACEHDFKEDTHVRACMKCGFSEALYY